MSTTHAANQSAPSANDELTPVRAFREFSKRNYPDLPESLVDGLLEDEEGFLWISTLAGLARFDGARLERVDQAGAPLGSALLARRPRGGVYAGDRKGLHTFEGSRWELIRTEAGVDGIAMGPDGQPWVLVNGGVRRLQVESRKLVAIDLPKELGTLLALGSGGPHKQVLVLGQQAMLVAGENERWVAGGAPPPAKASSMLLSRSGTVWLGTADGHLFFASPSSDGWSEIDVPAWTGGAIRALTQDERDQIWAGGRGQLAFGSESAPWQVWGEEHGLRIGSGILDLVFDRQGSLWIALNGAGLLQWVGEPWSHRTLWRGDRQVRPEPLSVTGLSATADGGFLAGVFGRGLLHYDGGTMHQYGPEEGLTQDVRDVAEPEPGTIWAGTRFGIFERQRGQPFRQILEIPAGFVQSFFRDTDGTWLALSSRSGCYRYRQGKWAPAADLNALLPDALFNAMTRTNNGDLWVASALELVVVDADGTLRRRRRLGLQNGMPESITAILEVAPGEVWAAGGASILVSKSGKERLWTPADGIPGHIYDLALGKDGATVWASGSRGVARYRDGRWQVTNSTNGLLVEEGNRGGLLPMPDGTLLVGTGGSLARFDPSVVPLAQPDLAVVWQGLQPPNANGVRELGQHQRSLRLRWTAPWVGPQQVEYRTRVTRWGPSWSVPTHINELPLENLGPGDWEIEVSARFVGGADYSWTPPAVARFAIEPFVWETTAARIMMVFAGLLAVIAVARLRSRHLEQRAARLESLIGERTADLETANAELQVAKSQIAEIAYRDVLTGLHNRRAAEEHLRQIAGLVAREKLHAAILLFDIDNFKKINDTYGHEVGDLALATIARCCESVLRNTEFLARFGGEEFLVVFQGEDEHAAFLAAERIRKAIALTTIDTPAGPIQATVSGGVADLGGHAGEPQRSLAAADAALYAAKGGGRNRIHRASRLEAVALAC